MTAPFEQQATLEVLQSMAPQLGLSSAGGLAVELSAEDADASSVLIKAGYEVSRIKPSSVSTFTGTIVEGSVTATGLEPQSLDLAMVAGQTARECGRHILFEAARILKPQAPLILAYCAPVCLPGTVVAVSENLARQFNPFGPQASDAHAIAPHLNAMTMAGFVGGQVWGQDLTLSVTRDEWIAYCCRQDLIQDANLSAPEMQDFRLILGDYIRRDFGNGAFHIPFRTLIHRASRPSA